MVDLFEGSVLTFISMIKTYETLGVYVLSFLDFTNKHVLVTGGSNGIGNGIARAFRDANAQVSITGTRAASTYQTDIREMEFLQADLGDDTAV